MKRLYLLRHAKSSRADPGLDDFDRPLNDRGRRATPRVAALMRAGGLLPDLVLCSAARRALETWEVLALGLGAAVPATVRRDLYLAPAERLLGALRELSPEHVAPLVIGHNPGLAELARGLAGPGSDPDALAALGRGYPTATLTVFEFDLDDWRGIGARRGRLLRFFAPGDAP